MRKPKDGIRIHLVLHRRVVLFIEGYRRKMGLRTTTAAVEALFGQLMKKEPSAATRGDGQLTSTRRGRVEDSPATEETLP